MNSDLTSTGMEIRTVGLHWYRCEDTNWAVFAFDLHDGLETRRLYCHMPNMCFPHVGLTFIEGKYYTLYPNDVESLLYPVRIK